MASTHLDVPTPDGAADAYAAWPDSGGPVPGVLFYMDIFGLRPVLREMVDKLASYGYYVLAPNVFHREGRTPEEAPDLRRPQNRDAFLAEALPKLREHGAERAERDAGAYVDFLTARPEVAPGPIGVTGYCLGGVLALRTAAARPGQVAAAASFHAGHVVTGAPDSPHLTAERITAELHLAHAARDEAMTPQDVAALERALDDAGVTYTSEVYPGTMHGFTMADVPAFSPEALDRHWERLVALLARRLGTD
ncbi:dienelactone hydrolase family protein [Streptomyces sp. HNM0574]|uniref:dienelactone hydrolase family protein n=1 Tax=Streptomyces sp. HNM0574 TaxID=2714954 RepID=UPI00146D72E6|nr:dienelactone hydrolase family protein [Streptomyces sp. HNM0574]NLU68148.1 dienelactone hydrolase family protein [Streptomyces sp. HNM0574]